MKNEATGLKRLVAATRFSAAGIKSTFATEEAFRLECWIALVLVPLAFWLGDNPVEIALMVGVVLILLITELLNTAVEIVVDRIGPEFHELSGRAKDAGSAAVLLASLLVLVVWVGALAE